MNALRHRSLYRTGVFLGAVVALSGTAHAAAVTRQAHGANAAAIQATVDQFRADLGGSNNGVGGSFPTGRREINWDGVPDASAAPNFLAADFFNVTSPRGVVLQSPCGAPRLSADSNNPTNTPVRFADMDASYSATFVAYTAERLFTIYSAAAASCEIVEIAFFVPGTTVPATVSGFGAVFTDVDLVGGTRIYYYAADGTLLGSNPVFAQVQDGGLSFVGVSFDAGERVARVSIAAGPTRLASGNTDEVNGRDVVAMDDFIYGEPRPLGDCIFQDAFECAVPPAP